VGTIRGTPYGWKNVWLGTTVGVRSSLWRLDALREMPAVVRFVSFEPLLESLGDIDLRGIDWVIVGGESGQKARPFDLGWAWKLRDQAHAAGAKFFMKQMGSKPVLGGAPCKFTGKGEDPSEFPPDLRMRAFPEAHL
jgi:protein gp37